MLGDLREADRSAGVLCSSQATAGRAVSIKTAVVAFTRRIFVDDMFGEKIVFALAFGISGA